MSLGAEARVDVLRRVCQFSVSDFEMQPVSTTVDLNDGTAAEGTPCCLFNVDAHEA